MIKHVFADGTVVEDITGITIPAKGQTAMTYKIIAEIIARQKKNKGKKQNCSKLYGDALK